jgi:predicted ribosome quality control (RQC) complex YloA/Tae2 family protein
MSSDDRESDFDRDIHQTRQILTRQNKRLQKSLERAHNDLETALNWKVVQKEGDLLKTNFQLLKRGMSSVTVWDWEENRELVIALNTKLLPQEEVSLRFHQSKKRQKGIPYLQSYLQELESKKNVFDRALERLDGDMTPEELDEIKKLLPHTPTIAEKKQKTIIAAKPYYEFESSTGVKIWVGKSAKDNDKLTFSCARGSDWWLHAQGCPGSHVVIRTEKGAEPDTDTIKLAVELALYYSKARPRGQGEVCLTQTKYISRFSQDQPGKVHVSKHKILYGRINPQRLPVKDK